MTVTTAKVFKREIQNWMGQNARKGANKTKARKHCTDYYTLNKMIRIGVGEKEKKRNVDEALTRKRMRCNSQGGNGSRQGEREKPGFQETKPWPGLRETWEQPK